MATKLVCTCGVHRDTMGYICPACVVAGQRHLSAPAKPQPLLPCEGCKWRVDTGRTRAWSDPTSETRYECHRYPPVMLLNEDGYRDEYRPSANGLGCGERQE